jgi:DNA-binding transcriptional LysR family regulator
MHSLLRDVEYFAAIAEHGQLQLAADALGLSQPALSMSLRRLEQAMNAKLLKRTPKGVELTSVGNALLARARKLRLSVDDMTREIADLSTGRAGHLRIGMAASSALHYVPMACAALLRESPRLTLKLTTGDPTTLVADLRNGALDIHVNIKDRQASHREDIIEEPLYDEEDAIYASANHRLAKRKQVTLADLAQERWALPSPDSAIVQLLTQAFATVGLPPPKQAVETSYLPARYYLVAATDLLAYSSKAIVEHAAGNLGIVALRVKDFSGGRHVSVRYRKDAYLPPVAFRFIEILKKVAGGMTKKNR